MSIPHAVSVELLIAWMIVLTIKHVIADFLLQTSWMAAGKERRTDWVKPLLAHTGIHGALLLVILLVAAPSFWWLAIVDFVVHTIIDRTKGLITTAYGLDQSNPHFWWAIGIDQALHHLTDFAFSIGLAAI